MKLASYQNRSYLLFRLLYTCKKGRRRQNVKQVKEEAFARDVVTAKKTAPSADFLSRRRTDAVAET